MSGIAAITAYQQVAKDLFGNPRQLEQNLFGFYQAQLFDVEIPVTITFGTWEPETPPAHQNGLILQSIWQGQPSHKQPTTQAVRYGEKINGNFTGVQRDFLTNRYQLQHGLSSGCVLTECGYKQDRKHGLDIGYNLQGVIDKVAYHHFVTGPNARVGGMMQEKLDEMRKWDARIFWVKQTAENNNEKYLAEIKKIGLLELSEPLRIPEKVKLTPLISPTYPRLLRS